MTVRVRGQLTTHLRPLASRVHFVRTDGAPFSLASIAGGSGQRMSLEHEKPRTRTHLVRKMLYRM